MKQTFAEANGSPFRNNLVSLNNINPFLALMSQTLTIESKEKKNSSRKEIAKQRMISTTNKENILGHHQHTTLDMFKQYLKA